MRMPLGISPQVLADRLHGGRRPRPCTNGVTDVGAVSIREGALTKHLKLAIINALFGKKW